MPPVGDPELIAPQPGMTLDFGEVALGKTYTARLLVSGKHLPAGYVSASVYTADKDMFSSATSQIPVAKVNSDDGYWLEVTYKPTVLGSHNSRLLLSGRLRLGRCRAPWRVSARASAFGSHRYGGYKHRV